MPFRVLSKLFQIQPRIELRLCLGQKVHRVPEKNSNCTTYKCFNDFIKGKGQGSFQKNRGQYNTIQYNSEMIYSINKPSVSRTAYLQ